MLFLKKRGGKVYLELARRRIAAEASAPEIPPPLPLFSLLLLLLLVVLSLGTETATAFEVEAATIREVVTKRPMLKDVVDDLMTFFAEQRR